jgi:Nif-specific regulatory protein
MRSAEAEFITENPAVLDKLRLALKVSKTESPVLILGESGTGKDLLARYIHEHSKRGGSGFLSMLGHAYDEELVLAAREGTLCIHEIADMNADAQASLLKLLKGQKFRIISSSSRNMDELVSKGDFKKELFFSLNSFSIRLPPLRERGGDVLLLVRSFLQNGNITITESAEKVISAYSWPGNITELNASMRRAINECHDGVIDETVIDFLYSRSADEIKEILKGNYRLKEAVKLFKKQFVILNLEKNSWNQSETARRLDLERTYLSRLIREFEIGRGSFKTSVLKERL